MMKHGLSKILAQVAGWLEWRDVLAPADAILVLDSPEEANRIAAALDLQRQRYAPLLLVSQTLLGRKDSFAPRVAETGPIMADRSVTAYGGKIRWLRSNALSTYEEALEAREVLKQLGCSSVLLVTSSYHTRRARMIFSRLLAREGIELHVFPAPVPAIDAMPWWKSKTGRSRVLAEYVKLISPLCQLDGHIPRTLRFRLNEWIYHIIP